MKSLSGTVLRNSAFGMGAQLIIKVLSLMFSIWIVRRLGADSFGQYAAVAAFGTMFIFISDLGLSPWAVREVARLREPEGDQAKISQIYANVLVVRMLLSVLAVILMLVAAVLTHRPAMMIGAMVINGLTLMLWGVQGTNDAVLSGFERIDLGARAKVLNQVVFVLLGTVALWLGAGYYGLVVANLVGVACLTSICWRNVRSLHIVPGTLSPGLWQNMLRASLPFGLIGFALGLSYRFDTVLLNIFRGDQETGYYNAAYNLVFTVIIVSNTINTSLYPSLVRQSARGPQALPAIYGRALRYLLILSLPMAIGAWALADQIIPLLYKSAYLPAVPALRIVVWVIPLMFVSEFLGYVVVIGNGERRVARAVLFSTGFNVAINLLLVPTFGLLAAATMTVVTEAVLVGQYLWMTRSVLRQVDLAGNTLRPLLAALLMGAVVLLLRPHVPLIANILCGVVIYAGLLLCFRAVGRDEMGFVRGFVLRRRAEAIQ